MNSEAYIALLGATKATKAWLDAAATRGAKTPIRAHELRAIVEEALEMADSELTNKEGQA